MFSILPAIFMTFTAVSLMTTTATLHQSFKISTASSAIFLFNLIPFSTLIIESSHMHKQKALSPYSYISLKPLCLPPLSRPNADFSFTV